MTAKALPLLPLLFLLLSPGVAPTAEPMSCKPSKVRHVQLTSQGKAAKYAIWYQSAAGDNCRLYRVHNFPAHPATTVTWKADNETLLAAWLPACPADTICPWIGAEKIGAQTEPGTSTLIYGANPSDSHSDSAQTFIAKPAERGELAEYQTTVRGVIEDATGKLTGVGILVDSKVEGTGPYTLSYRMSLVQEKSAPAGRHRQPVELARQITIWSPSAKKRDPGDLTVAWEEVTEGFLQRRRARLPVLALTADSPEMVTTISAKSIRLLTVPLVVRSGQKQIATTTAPAYVPVK